MRRRRVLVVSDLWVPFPGGAERLAFNIARRLADDHEVLVVTGYEAAQAFDGPPVFPQEIPLDGDGWRLIESAAKAFGPDVILTHHLYARTFHDDLVGLGLPVVQLVLNGHRMPDAALAVYISDWVRGQHLDAVDGDLTILPPAYPDVIASCHGDAIGFVKPIPHKGVDLVYRLAARLRRYRFVVLRGEWQTLERIVPLSNIRYLEPVVDIREFWSQVRAVLVPSLSEDAGTVAQEATLNGLPCISSTAGGLIETNGGGIRLPASNYWAWEMAVRRLDDPTHVARTVASQRAHLERLDLPGRLTELSERIGAL